MRLFADHESNLWFYGSGPDSCRLYRIELPEVFDRLVQQHKGQCDLVVTLVGLPSRPSQMKFWGMKKRPKLGIAGGPVELLRKAIKTTAVSGVVAQVPAPKDAGKTSARYVVITPGNIERMHATYPGVFKH